jgi:Pyruvate/2-oxoacid:ferredoxin oxidoreductase gamma subunit
MLLEKTLKIGQKIRYDRVRGGKIQRKKFRSAKAGYKISGKKLVRITPSEKRNRARSAKKASRTRAAKNCGEECRNSYFKNTVMVCAATTRR